jgi:hypothetical protein
MTAGHFGFAAGVKSGAQPVPLWALMVATYLMDFVFLILVGFGLESFTSMDPAHPAYGQAVIHAYYSHSLVGALILAALAGLPSMLIWKKRGGIVIGAVVFSHWVLDLIVHRPDLPILPGNAGNLPLLGFGLWDVPAATGLVEFALILGGGYLYYMAGMKHAARSSDRTLEESRVRISAGVMELLLLLLLATDFFGWSVSGAGLIMLLLIILCGRLDSRIKWPAPQ